MLIIFYSNTLDFPWGFTSIATTMITSVLCYRVILHIHEERHLQRERMSVRPSTVCIRILALERLYPFYGLHLLRKIKINQKEFAIFSAKTQCCPFNIKLD